MTKGSQPQTDPRNDTMKPRKGTSLECQNDGVVVRTWNATPIKSAPPWTRGNQRSHYHYWFGLFRFHQRQGCSSSLEGSKADLSGFRRGPKDALAEGCPVQWSSFSAPGSQFPLYYLGNQPFSFWFPKGGKPLATYKPRNPPANSHGT